MSQFLLFSIPFFCLATFHLVSTFFKNQRIADKTKCFLMPLIIVAVVGTFCLGRFSNGKFLLIPSVQQDPVFDSASIYVPIFLVMALIFGCAGDFFMLNPNFALTEDKEERKTQRRNYLFGILTFAIGHAFYLALIFLTTEQKIFSLPFAIILPIIYAIFIVVMYFMLKKPTGLVGFATVFYACILMIINFFCINPILGGHYKLSIFLRLAGNLFFLLSDSTISLTIFVKDFKYSRFVIMITYLVAQYLLALSFVS